MAKLSMHYLSLIVGSSLVFAGLCALWGMSVYQGHSEPFFQYVSDLAATSPEANIATWISCSSAVFLVLVCLVRYGGIQNYMEATKDITYTNPVDKIFGLHGYNKLSLASGLSIAAGSIMATSFRTSEGLVVSGLHGCGANFLFGGAFLDMIYQSRIAYLTGRPKLGLLRILCPTFEAPILIVCGIAGAWSVLALGFWEAVDFNTRVHWNSSQPGYWPHVISALFEWLAVLPVMPYVWSFIPEFQTYSLSIRSAVICHELPIVSSGLNTINID